MYFDRGPIMLLKKIFFASLYSCLHLHGMEKAQINASSPSLNKFNALIAAARLAATYENDIYIDPRLKACTYCGKIVINIKTHLKNRHPEKLHACSCGNRYISKSLLVAHQRICSVNRMNLGPTLTSIKRKSAQEVENLDPDVSKNQK